MKFVKNSLYIVKKKDGIARRRLKKIVASKKGPKCLKSRKAYIMNTYFHELMSKVLF